MIQQAVMQVLQFRWDPFSEHSYGFRPKRSAQQAVAKAQRYIADGNRWVVDLDLEKFFDWVNHDKLMAAITRRVTDKRVNENPITPLDSAHTRIAIFSRSPGHFPLYSPDGSQETRV